ncbi:uncharacterized protein LOC116266475 [Nymphaea colorata]|nr:uncharacterized protein LOC116266475 [Nymphaea colorata]
MSIILTPAHSPSPAFLYHRVSLSSLVSHSKGVLFPARADVCRVYASKRTWWDPDGENVRKERRSRNGLLDDEDEDVDKRSWWSRSADDYDDYYYDDGDSLFFEDEDEVGWTDVGFFKVLKSYGWMLPAIILSMLLATGPKAFLMALALPLGQTAFSFAADKLWGNTRAAPKPPKYKSRKSKYTNSYAARDRKPQTPNNVSEVNSSRSSSSSGNSWATSGKASGTGPTFGGWDELDIKEPRRQPLEPKRESRPSSVGASKGSSKKQSKMVRRGRNGEMPLLLRLLIAVFPFLGSWVKIL